MSTPSLIIDKKKYRLISEKEYQQLKEDLRDLRTILKRKNEKGVEARAFFTKLEKGKK
ncbi:MAG: hypothetical protein SGI96_11385 [Bacteroidota bacterium]|nr:hypothetical protein [Bacteroidota bacterium]